MIPMMLGFVVLGPISGALSDRIGARVISSVGMAISAVSFLLLATLSYNFAYLDFGLMLFMMGAGMGMFAAPNITAVMNSVAPQQRGVASGMRATLQNTGQTASMGIFFTIVLVSLTTRLPGAFTTALASANAPELIPYFINIPPTSALFSAFLGYNPVATILSLFPSSFTSLISGSTLTLLEGKTWFPNALASSFMSSLRVSFYLGALIFAVAAILSAIRGKRYIHSESNIYPGSEPERPVQADSISTPSAQVDPKAIKTESR